MKRFLTQPGNFRCGMDATSQELVGLELEKSELSVFVSRYSKIMSKVTSFSWFLMVTERLDESLLILHHLMQWNRPSNFTISTATHFSFVFSATANTGKDSFNFSAMYYLPQKVQNYTHLNPSKDADLLHALDYIQPYDFHLYRAANDILNQLIDKYNVHFKNPHRFQRDLVKFRRELTAVQKHCANSKDDKLCAQLRLDNNDAIDAFYHSQKSPSKAISTHIKVNGSKTHQSVGSE
jgi:sRNA-binding regulator protein Hfq